MKKSDLIQLAIAILVLSVWLTASIYSGSLLINVFKSMGANMVTLRDVGGIHMFCFIVWGAIGYGIYSWVNKK